MKTKHIILLFLLLTHVLLNSQNIKNGMYKNSYANSTYADYICINNDTITICFFNYKSCFKGSYQLKDNQIYLSENALLGRNANIIKEKCSPDSIEIRLVTKHKHYLIGMPSNDTNIYEYESDLYTMLINNTPLISIDTSGIYIAKGQFSDQILSRGFMLDDSGAGFTDYFNIPLEYGTRYIVKQKYYGFRPLIIYTKDYGIIKYNEKKKELKFKLSSKDKHYTRLKYISNNVDSCFNELKNRFPLLFE